MKTWQVLLLGIFLGLLASAAVILVASQPPGEPIFIGPPPTPSPIMVYVTGAVNSPGLYDLVGGSRVADAIQVAGGFSPIADQTTINLAAKIKDGDRIFVKEQGLSPSQEEHTPTLPPPSQDNPVNINTATLDQLDSLPGIGPIKAQDIIDFRTKNGNFKTIEDLKNVPGIGESLFSRIKDLITAGKSS